MLKDEYTVSEAAEFLGVSRQAIRERVRRGTIRYAGTNPQTLSASAVTAMYHEHRREALARHRDLQAFAREIVDLLWPPDESGSWKALNADGTADAEFMNRNMQRALHARELRRDIGGYELADAIAIFSKPVIETVARRDALKIAKACSWCFADSLAAVHDLPGPKNTESIRLLLGRPCVRDLDRWAAERAAAERELARRAATASAQVTPPRSVDRPSDASLARREYDEAERVLSFARRVLRQARESGNTASHRKANERYIIATRRFEAARLALQGRS